MKLYFKKLTIGAVYAVTAFALYNIVFNFVHQFHASVLISVLTVVTAATLIRFNNKKQKNEYLNECSANVIHKKHPLCSIVSPRDFKAELVAFITFAIPLHIVIFFKSSRPLSVLIPMIIIMFILALIIFTILDIIAWILARSLWKRSIKK